MGIASFLKARGGGIRTPMEDSPLNGLPAELVDELLRAAAPYRPVLARVCRAWDAALKRLARLAAKGSATLKSRGSLALGLPPALSARGLGRAGDLSLLRWIAADAGPPGLSRAFVEGVLAGAAEGGHEKACRLARKWGAADFDAMLAGAARGGGECSERSERREYLCRLAREWGARDFCRMIEGGAASGDARLCQLAREWADSLPPGGGGAVDFLVPHSAMALAARGGHEALCRLFFEWDETLRSRAPRAPGIAEAGNLGAMLEGAAMGGHEGLCRLALTLGTLGATDFERMLAGAAFGGHPGLCSLALEWGGLESSLGRPAGDLDPDLMLENAAAGGHEDVCRLAHARGASAFHLMLESAAFGGHLGLCRLALDWGARDCPRCDRATGWVRLHRRFQYFDHDSPGLPMSAGYPSALHLMLFGAAAGGHEDLCRLAREWAAAEAGAFPLDIFDQVLALAARYGHEEVCRLAREWGARDFNGMLLGAARPRYPVRGSQRLCRLALEWGADDVDGLLLGASDEDLCRLAREWGATAVDQLLRDSAHDGARRLCCLAREWGARDFEGMLSAAGRRGNADVCRLALEWGAKDVESLLKEASKAWDLRRRGNADVCRLALEWGAKDVESLLKEASKAWDLRLCELAFEWGARNFGALAEHQGQQAHPHQKALWALALEWKERLERGGDRVIGDHPATRSAPPAFSTKSWRH